MEIRYFDPLSRAWTRTKRALFQPFDLRKWFVVGFTAFLAGLMDWGGNRGSTGWSDDNWNRHYLDDIAEFPAIAWQWLMDHPGWFTLIVIGVFLFVLLLIVLTWLSSRGKFMFLDNVVHDRQQVAAPWRDYKSLGNSLFFWRLVYGLVVFIVLILLLNTAWHYFLDLYRIDFPLDAVILALVKWLFLFFIFMLVTGYISMFLDSFVVPIMYKNHLTAWAAWGEFYRLFIDHILHFLGFGIFVFVLMVLVVIGIIIAGFLTCCIGFILLIIPYINAVVLLPVSYTFRALAIEFLQQFGPNYRIFPAEGEAAA
ncbi:hypothetical protein JXO59_00400 [candidate division KSB1 bacterium]|nr:hypothetical protein [candidate division KSB1 bacterium]